MTDKFSRNPNINYSTNQNNAPDPADLYLRESAEREQKIGTKWRMLQYKNPLILSVNCNFNLFALANCRKENIKMFVINKA